MENISILIIKPRLDVWTMLKEDLIDSDKLELNEAAIEKDSSTVYNKKIR
jgi:hypothetical protein